MCSAKGLHEFCILKQTHFIYKLNLDPESALQCTKCGLEKESGMGEVFREL